MSTICKLDKSVRMARARRSAAVVAVRASANRQKDPKMWHAGHALANDLDAIRKDSRFAGPQKDARFRALMNR